MDGSSSEQVEPANSIPNTSVEAIRARIIELGWRQGSVMTGEQALGAPIYRLPFPYTEELPREFWAIVISQDCDVANGDADVEPVVEIAIATPIAAIDPARQQLRNPRELHFELRTEAGVRPVSVQVRDRAMIEKMALLDIAPRNSLVRDADVASIAALFGERYTRAAWPDAFERRLGPAKRRLKTVLQKYSEEIAEIFIALRPSEELDDKQAYNVLVYVVLNDVVTDGKQAKEYNSLKVEIKAAVRRPIHEKCTGINLDDVIVCSRQEVSLRELDHMRPIAF